jgi:hypothetical protein
MALSPTYKKMPWVMCVGEMGSGMKKHVGDI